MRTILMTLIAVTLAMTILLGCDGSSQLSTDSVSIIDEAFASTAKIRQIDIESTSLNWKGSKPVISEYLDGADLTLGYSIEMSVTSRSGPFTILTAVEPNGCIKLARVLSYPAHRGRDVKRTSFTNQFSGKCPDDPIQLGRDIQAVTGATLSCKAMTKGIRKSRAIVRALEK